MSQNGLARIRIIKSTLETSWYHNFVNKEFNITESFEKCVKIANQKDLPENVNYYVLSGDYIVIGKSKGRHKSENNWRPWGKKEHNDIRGFRINNKRKKPSYF